MCSLSEVDAISYHHFVHLRIALVAIGGHKASVLIVLCIFHLAPDSRKTSSLEWHCLFNTHRIHVWYIYLRLVDFYGKCR